jgi:Ger(x)C family germination protein
MLKKIFKFTAVLSITMLLLTGCWDDSSIEDKNIISTVILDYKDNKYNFMLEVVSTKGLKDPKEQAKPKILNLKGKGDTLIEARDDLNRKSDQELFLGAIKIAVFTKKMAEKGIEEYLNRIRTEFDYRKSLHLAVTSEEPEKLISDTPENSASIGDSIDNTLETQYNLRNSFEMPVGNILEIIAVKKVGFLIPEVNLEEEEPTLIGYSVFKDQKSVGTIPVKERKGVIYFLGNSPNFSYIIDYNGRKIDIKTTLVNKKIKPRLLDDELSFDIKMKFTSEIQYIDKLFNVTEDDLKAIEKLLEEKIIEDLALALETSQQQYKCDYLDFYKYFRAYNQSAFKNGDWGEMYSNAIMKLDVKAPIDGAKNLEINREK